MKGRLHAFLHAAWDRFLSRWQRPVPRHGGKPAESPGEPESEREGVSPAQLTRMDGFPVARVAPYVDPDTGDGPKHRRTR